MDILTKVERSARMALIRTRDTKPELEVRRMVYRMGFRYRLHGKLPGTPDLVFTGRSKVIFVNGCFWHSHRNCVHGRTPASRPEFWKPKLEKNAERDKRGRRELRNFGWRSLVIWQCELKNKEKLLRKIGRFLNEVRMKERAGKPRNQPVTLYPLKFEDALMGLAKTKPEPKAKKPQVAKKKRSQKA